MTTINLRDQVEWLLGRPLTKKEVETFKSLRFCGYANPYDIARKVRE